ncbi:CD27 antigen-like [Pungitius pungitius]|uniref:CD27 antigen-like n=1 Tax=Pungitius pungitius TaxID=134920 RepID=UPI002E112127
MVPRSLCLALTCVLSVCTTAAACGNGQRVVDGQCCDLCPPGTFMKGLCSEQKGCGPCEEGFFSDKYHLFGYCEKCRSCPQEVSVKCTATTDTKCSCRSGFLCSDNLCSTCENNTCVVGEKLNWTNKTLTDGLIKYSYTCEPQRDVLPETQREGPDSNHLTLSIVIVLLSLTLFVSVFYGCMMNRGKHREYNNPVEIVAVPNNASNFHLSKEESGLELIMQEESKNSNSLSLQRL